MAYLACLLLLSRITHTTQIEGLDVDGIDTRRAANRKDAGAAKRESSAVATSFLKLDQFRHEPDSYPVACHRPPFGRANSSASRGQLLSYYRLGQMVSLQQLSYIQGQRGKQTALPFAPLLSVDARQAVNIISDAPSKRHGRTAFSAVRSSSATRLRRGAEITWQTKCLSTPPTKRRRGL